MVWLAFHKAKAGGLVSHLINLFTGLGGFSHVELVYSDGLSYSSDRPDGGTRFKWIDYHTEAEFWTLVPVNVSQDGEAKARAFCRHENGCGYDTAGALGAAFPWHRQHPELWFCSEVCVTALQRAGLLTGIVPHKTSPNRLFKVLTQGD